MAIGRGRIGPCRASGSSSRVVRGVTTAAFASTSGTRWSARQHRAVLGRSPCRLRESRPLGVPTVDAPLCSAPPGDLVALKRGIGGHRYGALAIGEIQEPGYTGVDHFLTSTGWAVQHALPIAWRIPPEGNQPVYVQGLARGSTFDEALQAADLLRGLHEEWRPRKTKSLPEQAGREVSDEELVEALIAQGLKVSQGEEVVTALRRLRRLVAWYHDNRDAISEHEIRTCVVVPVLDALGWPEHRMKIEYKRTDIALFDRPFRPESEPSVIVETKRPWCGLETSIDQARAYAERHPTADILVVTDGFRYRLFGRMPRTNGLTWRRPLRGGRSHTPTSRTSSVIDTRCTPMSRVVLSWCCAFALHSLLLGPGHVLSAHDRADSLGGASSSSPESRSQAGRRSRR